MQQLRTNHALALRQLQNAHDAERSLETERAVAQLEAARRKHAETVKQREDEYHRALENSATEGGNATKTRFVCFPFA